MARISAEMVQKRETFIRSLFEKIKGTDKKVTLDTANDALQKHFGKDAPKMRAERIYAIRKEVLGEAGKGKPGRKPKTAAGVSTGTAPVTTAKRGPGRPRKVAVESGLYVVTGDVKHMLALCAAAGVQVQVDEAASQAVSALRSA